jgi:hypothetical protein
MPTKDLINNKKIPEGKTGLTMQRKTQNVAAGDSVEIEDISSTSMQVIDSLFKIFKAAECKIEEDAQESYFEKAVKPVLLNWHLFSNERKL